VTLSTEIREKMKGVEKVVISALMVKKFLGIFWKRKNICRNPQMT
jgi:hypothetical protein